MLQDVELERGTAVFLWLQLLSPPAEQDVEKVRFRFDDVTSAGSRRCSQSVLKRLRRCSSADQGRTDCLYMLGVRFWSLVVCFRVCSYMFVCYGTCRSRAAHVGVLYIFIAPCPQGPHILTLYMVKITSQVALITSSMYRSHKSTDLGP